MPAPKDYDALWRDVRNALAQLRVFLRNPLANTGLSATEPGTLQVDGDLVVKDGEVRSSNYVAGVSGWRLRPDGTIEMNDAQIRGGIIGNDALTNPVIPGSVWAEASDFTVS